MAESLDWINLMAYDFYAPSRSNVTESHSALYDPTGQVSGSYGVEAWIQAGMNSNNLVLGLPYYGYAYKLVDANNHGLLARLMERWAWMMESCAIRRSRPSYPITGLKLCIMPQL
ncbi:unnamed protein product [Thlaspi arvense]|uniref:GH18 domain-containing protein n=1 Tax=Thlaspi arvense TaxID=13288 RepID=A0AAU9S6U3_THLAR|nr:unnamed protein product [Thlaspi arvense]